MGRNEVQKSYLNIIRNEMWLARMGMYETLWIRNKLEDDVEDFSEFIDLYKKMTRDNDPLINITPYEKQK